MKTVNTRENKAIYTALYYRQEVAKVIRGTRIIKLGSVYTVDTEVIRCALSPTYRKYVPKYSLELKNISSLAEEDREYLGLPQGGEFYEWGTYSRRGIVHHFSPYEVDYLRSKGYALPWMGLTVEDLVSYGWVQLIK